MTMTSDERDDFGAGPRVQSLVELNAPLGLLKETFGDDLWPADNRHWSKVVSWTIEEATALSFGVEPNWAWMIGIEYKKRLTLGLRAQRAGDLPEPVFAPMDYIAWAKGVGIEFPAELERMLPQPKPTPTMSEEAPLHPREKHSWQQLCYGLVLIAYNDYDPAKARNSIYGEVWGDLGKRGITINLDTVRKHLKSAAEKCRRADRD